MVSHANASGFFETVNTHEPKASPNAGLSAAVWIDVIRPAQSSGLNIASGLLVFVVRIYQNFISEPQDAIDPSVVAALDGLLTAYAGDFELGGNVRCVDLLGMAGVPLSSRAGYLNADGKNFRIVDITLPVIVNDLWTETA